MKTMADKEPVDALQFAIAATRLGIPPSIIAAQLLANRSPDPIQASARRFDERMLVTRQKQFQEQLGPQTPKGWRLWALRLALWLLAKSGHEVVRP